MPYFVMNEMIELDPQMRAALVERILKALEQGVTGSQAMLRGSLAVGRGDRFSDIDVLWVVPDDQFAVAVREVRTILAPAGRVESLRRDIDGFAEGRRLFFVRFEGVPLFWRVDLEIMTESTSRSGASGEGDVGTLRTGSGWPFTESALMNAVAAIKSYLRGEMMIARQFLARAYRRVGLNMAEADAEASLGELIGSLIRHVEALDPSQQALAGRVSDLWRQASSARDSLAESRAEI